MNGHKGTTLQNFRFLKDILTKNIIDKLIDPLFRSPINPGGTGQQFFCIFRNK
ncbi:hypothetical protein HUR95_05930 [Caldalkalibacillus thermarum TA2.A1]|uniref:Uncharacterized protein n=1 Tax=Caldalkalibacillus thermarum (strain TA2.A1) TaxID=986075 RepID=A0A8X8ID01_CALTT|nr:hypothetical protein [Caldalkalibacillus thermarum]QZT35534.1 hypothetical protein HUR95_05930 [Caldalkalibacillus thermarum TA2.A1]